MLLFRARERGTHGRAGERAERNVKMSRALRFRGARLPEAAVGLATEKMEARMNARSSTAVVVAMTMMTGAGCASMSKTERGGAIGGGAGAAVGALIGHKTGSTARGAIIGAVVGGAAGALIGRRMDQQAQEIAR